MINRLIAVLASLLLAASLATAPDAYAQAKKDAPAAPAKAETKKPEAKKALLDINTAPGDELKALPGIGDVYAKKIIDNRPYQREDQLPRRRSSQKRLTRTSRTRLSPSRPRRRSRARLGNFPLPARSKRVNARLDRARREHGQESWAVPPGRHHSA